MSGTCHSCPQTLQWLSEMPAEGLADMLTQQVQQILEGLNGPQLQLLLVLVQHLELQKLLRQELSGHWLLLTVWLV